MTLVFGLLGVLTGCAVLLIVRWVAAVRRTPPPAGIAPSLLQISIGLITNFFDTLGIGSLATTTAAFRLFRLVPDELIPGTMIVGHALPVVTQALFFVGAIAVDPLQLTTLIACSIAGGWLGAGVVSRLSRRAVQLGMACALLIAGVFMLFGMFGLFPTGGAGLVLGPRAFVFALAVNFLLGALITLGIGNYAPSLIMFSLLGMDPRAAFPIMMGSGAFVATIAGVHFIATRRFDQRAALGLTVGGLPGVIIAAWLVQSLPLEALRWLVLAVVTYTAVTLLRAGLRERPLVPQTVVVGTRHEPRI